MRRELGLDEILDLAREIGRAAAAGLQHQERLDDLGAQRVGHADSRGEGHGGMLHQAVLDLAGADAVAGAGDDVVGAALEPEISRLVLPPEIAGEQVVAGLRQYSRNITGSGRWMAMCPFSPAGSSWPASSTTRTSWPGMMRPIDPARSGKSGALLPTTRLHSVWP